MFEVTERQLQLKDVVAAVESPDCGAVVLFAGTVRDNTGGRATSHLEYEAYAPMAERELARIGMAAQERWAGVRMAIAHRVGRLEIGEASVVIAAASAHRAEAFEACRFAIEELKQRVPIWKKEVWEGGGEWVEGPTLEGELG